MRERPPAHESGPAFLKLKGGRAIPATATTDRLCWARGIRGYGPDCILTLLLGRLMSSQVLRVARARAVSWTVLGIGIPFLARRAARPGFLRASALISPALAAGPRAVVVAARARPAAEDRRSLGGQPGGSSVSGCIYVSLCLSQKAIGCRLRELREGRRRECVASRSGTCPHGDAASLVTKGLPKCSEGRHV